MAPGLLNIKEGFFIGFQDARLARAAQRIGRNGVNAASSTACEHCTVLLPNHIRSRWGFELKSLSGQGRINLYLVEGQQ
jgi:hypothetical protein